MDNNLLKYLISTCNDVEIEINEEQATKFMRYLELLLEWNEKINLTAITEPHDVVVKHFVDSLFLLKFSDIPKGASFIDVGTGAGFPGVPIKIMRPDIKLTLLDSLNKRLNFLGEVCKELDIDVNLVHARAEDAGKKPELREKFDIATARAVAKLSVLSEYCIPLVKKGGAFISMKGPNFGTELKEGENAVKILGAVKEKNETFTLPDAENSERNITIFRKKNATPKIYPRHGNKISKSPL